MSWACGNNVVAIGSLGSLSVFRGCGITNLMCGDRNGFSVSNSRNTCRPPALHVLPVSIWITLYEQVALTSYIINGEEERLVGSNSSYLKETLENKSAALHAASWRRYRTSSVSSPVLQVRSEERILLSSLNSMITSFYR